MNRIFDAFAAILLLIIVLIAQQSTAPFFQFEQELQNERGGFAGNKGRLAKFFDAERRRLGDNFETELLKWLGDDPEKHYWISSFLVSESYLHGSEPLSQLSLLIKQQGLGLVQAKSDEESRCYVVRLSVTAAILSSKIAFKAMASFHKTEAEGLLLRHPELRTCFPGLYETDRRRYEEIESTVQSRITTVVADTNPPPKATISGGVLNGRASNRIKPSYPARAREAGASGEVTVQIVIDETGRVIWARAVSGHPMLQKAAEEAAWQTKVPPTKLSGQPVKVSGVLLYNFVP